MSRVVELLCSRRVPQVAVLALMSFGFAGCSADMSTRLSQNSFSNPFASQPEATGSVPTAAVERRELPQYSRPQSQYQSAALPPPISAPQSYPAPAPACPAAGAGWPPMLRPPISRWKPPAAFAPRSVAARPPMQGGTTIIVGTSDTLEILARRYHVSPAAIMQANGYKGPRALSPGQQLIIPHPTATRCGRAGLGRAGEQARRCRRAALRAFMSSTTAIRCSASRATTMCRWPNWQGPIISIPSAKLSSARSWWCPAPRPLPRSRRLQQPGRRRRSTGRVAAPPVTRVAAADNQQKARLAQAAPNAEEPAVESPVKAEATGALPTFRWPVRGKVITAYGAKTNGKANDGINLAVPEGTPVKAADDGVVAYSGNELKGYGNLVLIRHANGYVTAYAHASELLVKRGDTIKRGQVIAKSGQSGEVQSPQLHFEIRKGSSPVDPLQFLNGA